MKNITVNIEIPKLLSRRQILEKEGLYRKKDGRYRFLVVGGQCIILGDVDPFYISSNSDMDSPLYIPCDDEEVIVTVRTKQ